MDARQAVRALVEGILAYEGCLDGKVDFLERQGFHISDPRQAIKTVEVRLFVDVNVGELDGGDVEDAIQNALDNEPWCHQNSTYVTEVRVQEDGHDAHSLFESAEKSWDSIGADEDELHENIVEEILANLSPPPPSAERPAPTTI